MNANFRSRVQHLNQPGFTKTLRGIKRGFEKECLRVNAESALIAKTPHPKALGSSLTNPMITTDYSEALLEFITPPTDNIDTLFNTLTELHQYTCQILNTEFLWASSMPCHLPKNENDIPIAEYGKSNFGRLKNIYRRGLGFRYGRAMQTIAGIHYNFSLPNEFWEKYHTLLQSKASLPHFISEQYLGLIRNCLRFSWILPYLFGASPAVEADFLKTPQQNLEKLGESTWIGPYATSLRLSDLGYHNKTAPLVPISYDSYDAFVESMHRAVHTKDPNYTRIGVLKEGIYQQLSDGFLQVEDEHYSLFRPKRVSPQDERMLATILREGIEYIEIRALDINPFLPLGVELQTIDILDLFLMGCLLMDSPPLTDAENHQIQLNQEQAAKEGRDPKLPLRLHSSDPILKMMEAITPILNSAYTTEKYTSAFLAVKKSLNNTGFVPSAEVLKEMQENHESHIQFVTRWSQKHFNDFKSHPLSKARFEYYAQIAQESLQAQLALEQADTVSFEQYLQNFLIT